MKHSGKEGACLCLAGLEISMFRSWQHRLHKGEEGVGTRQGWSWGNCPGHRGWLQKGQLGDIQVSGLRGCLCLGLSFGDGAY